MPSRIILCPGQGAQFVGMGKAWHEQSPEARAVFERADKLLGDRLGSPLTSLCFDGPVDRLNQTIDTIPPLEFGEWYGNTQRRDYTKDTGLELHNSVELGSPFEELIDHPGWINLLRHFCGEEHSYVEGLFIDECIVSVRRSGGHHPVHSGGYQGALRGAYHYANGVFRCGQCNVILALTDIGPGDGATMIMLTRH